MDKYYPAANPNWGYKFNETMIATDGGGYQTALDQALKSGGSAAPDIYCAEEAFILKYSQGDYSEYAAAYKDLGIDDAKVQAAQIAPYTIQMGSRSGTLVALGYQTTGGAFIYRRSIAKDVFGSDDPAAVEKEIGPGWDKFWEAAEKVKAKGYAAVSGKSDIWFVVRHGNDKPYIQGDKFVLDPVRESFLDTAKLLVDNDYSNRNDGWGEGWFADMNDTGARKVFGFFGPAWLINYVMSGNAPDTAGDWAVTVPPVGFNWGGTWLLANKDTTEKDGVSDFIQWVTVDTSNTGLQYLWANGMINTSEPTNTSYKEGDNTKDTVASAVVMGKSNGEVAFLGGQNMFDIFVPANEFARGDNQSQFDEGINEIIEGEAGQYAEGLKTRDEAVAAIKQQVLDKFGYDS